MPVIYEGCKGCRILSECKRNKPFVRRMYTDLRDDPAFNAIITDTVVEELRLHCSEGGKNALPYYYFGAFNTVEGIILALQTAAKFYVNQLEEDPPDLTVHQSCALERGSTRSTKVFSFTLYDDTCIKKGIYRASLVNPTREKMDFLYESLPHIFPVIGVMTPDVKNIKY
jgi:hypothetical protein